jgi:integrase
MASALNYHRCHGKNCEGGHAAKSFSSEPEERKKGWARCKCPIVASGSLDRVARRMATKQTDWAAAASVMAPYLAAGSWTLAEDYRLAPELPEETPVDFDDPKPRGWMADAVKAYLRAHTAAGSAESTITGHRIRLATTLAFCERKGIVRIDQWSRELVREFLNEATDIANSTADKNHRNLKAFFAWCITEKWTAMENPARYKAAIKNRATAAMRAGQQKYPFSDEELARMYAACQRYEYFVVSKHDRKGEGKLVPGRYPAHNRKWIGEDLADFIAVSAFTGLRISDTAMFHVSKLKGQDEIHIRTTKGDTPVYTAVPLWLADRIRERAEKVGPYIFGEHSSKKISVITGEWRKRLKALWLQCGPWEKPPTPHRFRHTFARILLEDNNSPSDVAQLMGNTEAVVREYYSAWMPTRQEETSKRLRRAFANVPTPFTPPRGKVLPIAKRG